MSLDRECACIDDQCAECDGSGETECECVTCGDCHDRECEHCDGTGTCPYFSEDDDPESLDDLRQQYEWMREYAFKLSEDGVGQAWQSMFGTEMPQAWKDLFVKQAQRLQTLADHHGW